MEITHFHAHTKKVAYFPLSLGFGYVVQYSREVPDKITSSYGFRLYNTLNNKIDTNSNAIYFRRD